MKLDGKHISIDIEACGEVVLSVGACEFDPVAGTTSNHIHIAPSIDGQIRLGLKLEAKSLLWLLKQNSVCRDSIVDNQLSVHEAYRTLREWWPDRFAMVWAYPASFDFAVLSRSMNVVGSRVPWSWKHTLDGRTLWKLACAVDPEMKKVELPKEEQNHNALEDAIEQAGWYCKYLKAVCR